MEENELRKSSRNRRNGVLPSVWQTALRVLPGECAGNHILRGARDCSGRSGSCRRWRPLLRASSSTAAAHARPGGDGVVALYRGHRAPAKSAGSGCAVARISFRPRPHSGSGLIYNSQYVKGLLHVVVFGMIISILSSGAAPGFEPLFGFMIPAWILYMAFEAYHTAKRRLYGQPVDEFSGLVGGRRGGFPAGPVVSMAVGILFLLINLDLLRLSQIVRYWPMLLIALGIYLLYERFSPSRRPCGCRGAR